MAQEEKNDRQATLCLIKPDAVKAGNAFTIRQRIEKEGFNVAIMRKETLTKEKAETFYQEHKERSFFNDLVTFMTSGPIYMLKLVKPNAIKDWRSLMGPTDSAKAKQENAQCIRALYGTDVQQNAVHGSDSEASAKRELDVMFPDLVGLKAGFLSPRDYMKRALEMMKDVYSEVHAINVDGWEEKTIENTKKELTDKNIKVVAGYSQKDAFHHILFNEFLGYPVPSRKAFLYCMNKYLMRTIEKDAFWYDFVDPINEDFATICAKIKEYPFMLKNTSLSLGRGIFSISDEKKLKVVLEDYKADKALQDSIAYQMGVFSKGLEKKDIPNLPPFISEHKVDINSTIEYCYEGFVTPDGKLIHYALTEEVYFKNHSALGYLTPPMSLPKDKVKLIQDWVEGYMSGYIKLGYINQFFNLELWLSDKDEVFLTEINPRAAHSFHYNYLYSFGTRLYEDNMELARGADVTAISEYNPWTLWLGNYSFSYTLIVLITVKETGKLTDILDWDYVNQLETKDNILIRYNRQKGDTLVENDMTSAGCMILQMWIVGETAKALIGKETEIRSKIYKNPQSGNDYPAYWKV